MARLWLGDVLVQQKNHCNWDGEWALKAAPGVQNVDMMLDHQQVFTKNHSSNVLSGSEENAYLNKIFCCWPSMILEEGLSHNISRRRIIKLQRLRLSFHPLLPALTTPPTAIKRTNKRGHQSWSSWRFHWILLIWNSMTTLKTPKPKRIAMMFHFWALQTCKVIF